MTESSLKDAGNASHQGITLFGLRMPDRIPPLSGWFLRLFQVFWWAIFAAALVGTALFAIPGERRAQEAGLAVYSTGLNPNGNLGLGFAVVPMNEAVRNAGVREDDVVIAVDGNRLANSQSEAAQQFAGPDGSIARVTVRHADGTEATVPLVRDSNYIKKAYAGSGLTFETRRWTIFWIEQGTSLLLLFVSLVLVLKCAREPVAAMLALALTVSTIPFYAMGTPDWLNDLSQIMLIVFLPLGISLFPDNRFVSRWNWLVVLGIIVTLASLFSIWNRAVPGFDSFLRNSSIVMLFALLAVAVMVRYRALPPGTKRQQLKFFTLGLIVLSLFEMSSALINIIRTGQSESGTYGWLRVISSGLENFGFTVFGIGILISLLRYRLYDAERTISRSVALGALTLSLLAIFAGSEKVIELLGEEWFGEDLGALAGGLGAAVAALLIVPLHKRIDHWAERRFQTELTKLRDIYPLLVADLRETMEPKAIADHLLDRVLPTIRSVRGVLLLDTEPLARRGMTEAEFTAWRTDRTPPEALGLQTEAVDPLLPTRLSLEAPGHGRIGWLLLGPRPDGSTFGKDERETLEAIADPLARALLVAGEREARESERAAQFKKQTMRIRALEERFDHLIQSLSLEKASILKS